MELLLSQVLLAGEHGPQSLHAVSCLHAVSRLRAGHVRVHCGRSPVCSLCALSTCSLRVGVPDVGVGVVDGVRGQAVVPPTAHAQTGDCQPLPHPLPVVSEREDLPIVGGKQYILYAVEVHVVQQRRRVHRGLVKSRPPRDRASIPRFQYLKVVHERRHDNVFLTVTKQVRDERRRIHAALNLRHPSQLQILGAVPRFHLHFVSLGAVRSLPIRMRNSL
mmetsp:Transcript_15627/g.47142  ORF Transcript_15627/g.47142 Transcript_15627/m.47142 type:complete len:219 (+) Transcript_15627:2214-2870(+)